MDANTSQQFGVLRRQLLDHMQAGQTQHKSELDAIVQRLDEINQRLVRLEEKAAATDQ